MHGEIVPEHEFAACYLNAFDQHRVLPWLELEIVTNAQGRHDHAQFLSKLATHRFDALQQFALALAIHQGDETIPHLEFEEVDGRQIVHGVRGWLWRRRLLRLLAGSVACCSHTRPTEVIGRSPTQHGQRQQREAGEPWYPT